MDKHVKAKEKFIWVGFALNAFGSNVDKLNTHVDIMEFNIPYGSILFLFLIFYSFYACIDVGYTSFIRDNYKSCEFHDIPFCHASL